MEGTNFRYDEGCESMIVDVKYLLNKTHERIHKINLLER